VYQSFGGTYGTHLRHNQNSALEVESRFLLVKQEEWKDVQQNPHLTFMYLQFPSFSVQIQ
jgi:hypothetical protein